MVSPYKLIEQGIHIFPTDAKDKRPVVTAGGYRLRWSQHMTTDPAQVAQWEKEYPGCNWGIPTGQINNIVVVDIDSQESEAWWDSQWLPEGHPVRSRSGGLHLYYELNDDGLDIQTNKGTETSGVHKQIDIRGEGGYVVAYTDELSEIPTIPASVIELLPARKHYEVTHTEGDATKKPQALSEGEKRVLKGITDALDALTPPWKPGAGWHDVQFRQACHLNRIANSPDYATTKERAYSLFMAHAPLNNNYGKDAGLREERWHSAVKATEGQAAEPPGDVPVRLDAHDLLDDKFQGVKIEQLFWSSTKIGEVKELIHELRMLGATKQEAYSISYMASAMLNIRKRDPENSASTWGFVEREYDVEDAEPRAVEQIDEEWGTGLDSAPASRKVTHRLLSEEERTIIRDYPNFIDRYVAVAQQMFAEPNMPLTYVNAWLALSAGVGDRGRVQLEGKSVPLSLWGLLTADSAAGKGDALSVMESAIGGMRRGGLGDVNIGYDASAEGLNAQLMEREGRVALMIVDEASSMLQGFKDERSYYAKLKTLALKLFDGRAVRAIRSGTSREEVGEETDVTFNLWLQTTWDQVASIMDEKDIQSGLVGRMIIAIGDKPKITDESLSLRFASEYQVALGRHPLMESLTRSIRQSPMAGKTASIDTASDAVGARYVQVGRDMLSHIKGHPLENDLRGIVLRMSLNVFKAAALLALSEGRSRVEMEDLLIAIKSGEYWFRDCLLLVDAISSSQYRRLVDAAIDFVSYRPRTTGQILSAPRFKNMKNFEVMEVLERAEKEGKIVFRDKKWFTNDE